MPNPYFSFKQFTVYHHRCAMKVGIDGVLLGIWAPTNSATDILDVGTGTGLIALMLAQRSSADIDAVDIDADAVMQALENVESSPWPNRIKVHQTSMQDFALLVSKKYDLIVSNPPYFVDSTKTPVHQRTIARHADTLTHSELIDLARMLLKPTGRICLILPVNEGLQCINYATQQGLFCSKKLTVFPKPNVAAKRLLIEFSLQPAQCQEAELTIESDVRHQYTPEFTALAKDFYLKL